MSISSVRCWFQTCSIFTVTAAAVACQLLYRRWWAHRWPCSYNPEILGHTEDTLAYMLEIVQGDAHLRGTNLFHSKSLFLRVKKSAPFDGINQPPYKFCLISFKRIDLKKKDKKKLSWWPSKASHFEIKEKVGNIFLPLPKSWMCLSLQYVLETRSFWKQDPNTKMHLNKLSVENRFKGYLLSIKLFTCQFLFNIVLSQSIFLIIFNCKII